MKNCHLQIQSELYTSNNQLSHVTVTKITQSNILIVMKDINHRG